MSFHFTSQAESTSSARGFTGTASNAESNARRTVNLEKVSHPCLVYEKLRGTEELQNESIEVLTKKYSVSKKLINSWRAGRIPAGWTAYTIARDPECSYPNVRLMMDRYGCVRRTVNAALWLLDLSTYPYRQSREEKGLTYGASKKHHTPSPISPWLARWPRSPAVAKYVQEITQ